MADRPIVPMDSCISWLAGIATCTGDFLETELCSIPHYYEHRHMIIRDRLCTYGIYTLCDVGT